MRPLGRRVMIQKCINAVKEMYNGRAYFMRDGLAWPQETADTTNLCDVIDCANDCKVFRRKEIRKMLRDGKRVLVEAPERSQGLDCVDKELDIWVVKEDELPGMVIVK